MTANIPSLQLPWSALNPLLQGTFRDGAAVLACLNATRDHWLDAAHDAAARRRRNCRHLRIELDDVEHEALLTLADKACRRRGLPRPKDRATPARAWLRRVIKNAIADRLRLSERAGGRGGPADDPGGNPPPVASCPFDEAFMGHDHGGSAATIELRIQARQLGALAVHGPTTASARQRLALACHHVPDAATPALLAEAARELEADAPTPIGVERRLARLAEWTEAHRAQPESEPARLHLAWALRGDDTEDPGTWRQRDPRAASKADDLARRWAERAALAARRLLEDGTPPRCRETRSASGRVGDSRTRCERSPVGPSR